MSSKPTWPAKAPPPTDGRNTAKKASIAMYFSRASSHGRVSTCFTTRRCSRKGKGPKVKPLPPRIERGALSRAQIRRVILRQKGAYQHCYEQELQRHRGLKGKVELYININGQGKVSLARVDSSSINNARVERCILRRIRLLKFPVAENMRSTVVRYPLRFESQ